MSILQQAKVAGSILKIDSDGTVFPCLFGCLFYVLLPAHKDTGSTPKSAGMCKKRHRSSWIRIPPDSETLLPCPPGTRYIQLPQRSCYLHMPCSLLHLA